MRIWSGYIAIFLSLFSSSSSFSQDYEEIYNLTSSEIDFYWTAKLDKEQIKENVLDFVDSISYKEKLPFEETHLLKINAEAEIEFIFSNKSSAHKLLLEGIAYHEKHQLNPVSATNFYQLLFGINTSVFNLEKAKYYSDKINENISLYKSDRYKFVACKSKEVLGRLSNDTTLVLDALNQRIAINPSDSSLLFDAQLDKFIFLNNSDSVAKYAVLVLQTTDSSILMTRYMRLLRYYYGENEMDSAYKYANLTLNDEYAKQIIKYQKEALEKIIAAKIVRGDTVNLKDYQAKLNLVNSNVSKGQASEIVNRESIYDSSNAKRGISWWYYLILILVLFLILFIAYKRTGKRNNAIKYTDNESDKKYVIPEEHEQKIKKALLQLEEEKYFLNRNISLTNIGEKYDIINTNYISKYISNNFSDSFPNWIAKLRLQYFIDNQELFKECDEEEVSFKLGFGSVRTFRKHLNLNQYDSFESLLKK